MPRYTIDINEEFDNVLDQLAKQKKSSKAEIIRRAVNSYDFLQRQMQQNNDNKLSITTQQDRVIKDIVLP